MKSWFRRFNTYFALAGLFFHPGCTSDTPAQKEAKKEQSTIRLYLEGNRSDPTSTGTVQVTHANYLYTVEREPFLTEADLSKATLVDDGGPGHSYFIQLLFDEHGTLFLDMTTTANRGRHIILFSQFPVPGEKQPKPKHKFHSGGDEDEPMIEPLPPSGVISTNHPRESAWLTAYLIRDRNASGLFSFTPDATHEECVRIVRGLQNVIAAKKKAEKF
jgi:hypothetical protein